LTDGQGRTIDFKNTVIIMTSNIGSEVIQNFSGDEEYELIKANVMAELGNHFKPEFINRVDETVVFHPLVAEQIEEIAKIQINALAQRLLDRGLTLNVTPEAIRLIAEVGFDSLFGARPLNRAIQQSIENPLAQKILAEDYQSGDIVTVDKLDGSLHFN